MSAFARQQKRFLVNGLSLASAKDTQAQGKWPVLVNVRSYQQGTMQSRAGLTPIAGDPALGAAVHSLYRLSDTTPFASIPARFVLGSGGNLNAGPAGGPFPGVDAGYSGSPLSMLAIQPPASPQPWLYVADSARMRKLNVNGLVYPIGIASPTTAPSSALDYLHFNIIQQFGAIFFPWVNAGAAASGGGFLVRVNTTIAAVIYDSGVTGNVSIIPTSMDGIADGMLLSLNAGEVVAVAEVTIAIANTTIASIIYDAGVSGVCTIQPTASLGTGQLEAPSLDEYRRRAWDPSGTGTGQQLVAGVSIPVGQLTAVPATVGTTPLPRIRQVDFPVNALVRINGAETVRILSVAVGPDGVQSFRCVTAGTFAAGQTLTGTAAFRTNTTGTHLGGETITDQAYTNTITPVAPIPPATGASVAIAGVMTGAGYAGANLSQIDGRATQPDDDLHLSIKFSDTTAVATVRIYFDVDAVTKDFSQNYFFFEWRANDILAAIQSANTASVASIQDTRVTVQANSVTNLGPFSIEKGGTASPDLLAERAAAAAAISGNAASRQIAFGQNQWIDLRCKVKDLIRVGTDPSRTLANVGAAEILVGVSSAVSTPVVVAYDAIWLSGSYGADIGSLGNPIVYRYSYRSSVTGARSNPSPGTRGGVIPRRQRVLASGVQSADPQCDLVDWWRLGGGLTSWTYVGTTPNTNPPTLNDDYGDTTLDGGQTLEFDNFQPWPSTDLPRTGTCNVAGSALRWVSGDHFNTSWSEGSAIIVNGRVYTMYAQPSTTTLLFLNENAGSGTNVPFTVLGATLVSQNLPVLFGGPIGGTIFTFACGDPNNPGSLYWAKGNLPDMASDRNSLAITAPSEPLMGGCLYDGLPYVFSSDELYVVEPDFNNPQQFRALVTPCHRGLWTRWAVCATSIGIAFLAKDGIYVSRNGGPAVSLTDQDLYNLFPHDGIPGVTVNGFHPPDMTQFTKLRLTWADDYLYFDYVDTSAESHTLVYRISDKSWWGDTYTPGITARFWELGLQVHQELIGGANGHVFNPSGVTDNGTAFTCQAQVVENQTDARAQKLYRDVMTEMDGGGATVGLAMTLTNGTVTPAGSPASFVTVSGRKPYYATIDPTGMAAYGSNLTLTWTFPSVSLSGPSPILYLYDIGYQLEPELAVNWLSGPTTHMLPGYQQVPLALLAYLSSGPVTFNVIIDGVLFSYTLPSTGGVYLKKFFRLQSVKGLTFQYGFQASAQAAFMLFDRDCEIWVQPWGYGGNYQKTKPFSGGQIGVGAQGNVTGDR